MRHPLVTEAARAGMTLCKVSWLCYHLRSFSVSN